MNTLPIIALDFPNQQEVETFLNGFPKQEKLFIKIGMELYYQEGPKIVHWLKQQGHSIFLDLKLHDIPNTVEKAMYGLAKLGVDLTCVHDAGGIQMMSAAINGLENGTPTGQKRPMLLAITQLTSTTEEKMHKEQLIEVPLQESVIHYAKCARQAGLDGVVSSALEVKNIKKATKPEFICLSPGIRPKGSKIGDQKRIVTPHKAHQLGSDFIVVGRPITQSSMPYETYVEIKKEWDGGSETCQ
ncbi:orotidine-5'-phosphate decarboxylase [Melissococcus plutonius]|uniref:orotidine-5'-phosphate decarboxylase n=1 Tax=Melissococcus plutonius TaxID=33970 RepID=UPI003C2D6BD1